MSIEQFVDTQIFPTCNDCGRRLKPTEKVRLYMNSKETGILLVVCSHCNGVKKDSK